MLLAELIEPLQKFCRETIEPLMESDDHAGLFRVDLFKTLGQMGFTGITTPESYGGVELSSKELTVILEELGKYSVAYAVTLSVSTMVQAIILKYGNNQQKDNYLPALASGKEIGAFCLTESSSGSDAAALKLKAKKTKDGYVLNGHKLFITSAGIAKTYIVMARTGEEGPRGISAFIVRDGTPGFTYGKLEKKMGWKISPTRELVFENCLIPAENLLGKEGEGFKLALWALDKGRISIGAIAVGLAQRALDECFRYSFERKQFNQPLYHFQGTQMLLADLFTEVSASRLLVSQAAILSSENKNHTLESSMAKCKASDTAMRVTSEAVQLFGGVGYTAEYPLERFMRDAKGLQIVEGVNQIQRLVIARQLQQKYA